MSGRPVGGRLGVVVIALVALVAMTVGACGHGDRGVGPAGIDLAQARRDLAALVALGPRPADSPAAAAAARYVTAELAAVGVHAEAMPVGDVALGRIVVLGHTYREARRAHTDDANLLARFGPGDGRALLLMAHYDTVVGSPGAVDNAAAVAVLLGLGRILAASPPATPVVIAFTADEEDGLVGAEALADRRGDDVALAISLDVIGGTGPLTINGASTLIGAAELGWLAAAADRAAVELDAAPVQRVASRWWPQAERSDHGPFTRHGVRAVHLYDRGHDGEHIDLAYHTPRDTLERVELDAVAEVGRLVRALALSPPPARAGDGYWLPIGGGVVITRAALIAGELALALLALTALLGERTPRRAGLGLAVGAACYAAGVAATLAVERLPAGGHPAPWLHAPLRAELGLGLVLVGTCGLALRVVGRRWSWVGARRYLLLAIAFELGTGLALLVGGAAELAWLWLAPAACLALALRLGRLAPLALIAAAAPLGVILSPTLLREAAFNGFLPIAVPLTGWLAALGLPLVAAVGWWLRTHSRPGPLGALFLSLGCVVAIGAGLATSLTTHPICDSTEFSRLLLYCEVGAGVR